MDVHGHRKEEVSNLKRKAIEGAKWTTVSRAVHQGIQFLVTLILARMLTPSDFGLISMTVVVTGFITLFNDLGTSAAVIREQTPSNEFLSSIFWMNIVFGAVTMLLIIVGAPLVSRFYNEPRITRILQVLSVTFLFSGLGTVQQALLDQKMAFGKSVKFELVAMFMGGGVGISAAASGYGVWSLVFQAIAANCVGTILLWISTSWRPHWVFRWGVVKEIWNFSANLVGFNVFNYFSRNFDYFLIGVFLGARDLGFYTLAYRIMLYPLSNISSVAGRVLFPTYSKMQNDDVAFRRIYLKTAGAIAFVTFPMMAGLIVLAAPFVSVIFGYQWAPVGTLILVLAPVGMIQSLGTTVGAIYQAKGRTDWMFRWGIGATVLNIIAFLVGLHWGIMGVGIAYVFATLALCYPNFSIPFRLIGMKVVDLWITVRWSLAASVLMALTILVFQHTIVEGVSAQWELAGLFILGCLVYALFSWIINRHQLSEIRSYSLFVNIK